jgi:CubicO group peptidase (beta-lactamase class C family)
MRNNKPVASEGAAPRFREEEIISSSSSIHSVRFLHRCSRCSPDFRFRVFTFGLVVLLWAVVFLGTGCRTSARRLVSDPQPAVARLDAGGSIQAEADQLVKPLLASGEVYGMVVGVVTPDGATQAFRYGRSGRAGDKNPPDTNSLFEIGSISKIFVATVCAQLVVEGRLRYEDTVSSILPTNVPVSAEVGRLTLYELLTHTGGLPREPFTFTQLYSLIRYFVTGRNLYAHLTPDYVYRYLRHCHPRPGPHREFLYSNIGVGLLASLVEIKTGQPVTNLIVDRICRPLNMSDSVFTLDANQKALLTVGHVGSHACWKFSNSPMKPWDMGDLMRPSGSMYSTLDDLLIFARANLGFLHHPLEPLLASTHTVQVETPRGGEAFGWIVNRFNDGRQTITFKDGMISGYCGYIGMDLDARVAVVVLSNKFNWDDKVGHNLLLRLSGFYTANRSVSDSLPAGSQLLSRK